MLPPNLARALAKGTVMSCLFCFVLVFFLLADDNMFSESALSLENSTSFGQDIDFFG